jgi:hypothetical protein
MTLSDWFRHLVKIIIYPSLELKLQVMFLPAISMVMGLYSIGMEHQKHKEAHMSPFMK